MNIEVKIDENYAEPKILIYSNKVDEKLSNIIDNISNISQEKLKAYKDEKMYILNQNEIEAIYAEKGKVYLRCNSEVYIVKNRLYELENILNQKIFVRISNSEIVNFDKVRNLDFKIIGTIVLNFKSGNKAYVSRRYITKIKNILEI